MEVMEFIKKLCVCDEDAMQPDDIITYVYLLKEAMREHRDIVESKRWEPTDNKKIYKDEHLLMMDSVGEIEDPVNKTLEKAYCKSRHNGKYNDSGVGSSTKSVATCQRCGKKVHLKRN